LDGGRSAPGTTYGGIWAPGTERDSHGGNAAPAPTFHEKLRAQWQFAMAKGDYWVGGTCIEMSEKAAGRGRFISKTWWDHRLAEKVLAIDSNHWVGTVEEFGGGPMRGGHSVVGMFSGQ